MRRRRRGIARRTGPRRLPCGGGSAVASLCLFVGCASPFPDSRAERETVVPAVVIDGRFEEWSGVAASLEDPADAPGHGPDIRGVRLAGDADALYLLIDLGRVVNVQGLNGRLELALDADGDPATGGPYRGLEGVDLVIHFTRFDPSPPGRRLDGIVVHTVPSTTALSANDIGLRFEPRHSTDRIELRLERRRRLPDGRIILGDVTVRGRLACLDSAGALADETEGFRFTLTSGSRDRAGPGSRRPTASLSRAPGTDLRSVTWNVAGHRLQERAERFGRLLAALEPDIVLLDEVSPETGTAAIRAVLPPLGEGGGWHVVLGSGGGRQRGAIASRAPLETAEELRYVSYPDSVLEMTMGLALPGLPEVARNARRGGIPVAGAEVTLDHGRLLAVAFDLVCCGNSEDAPQDAIRRIETAAIRDAVERQAAAASHDGVLLGGDFNLVGSRHPLAAAARALDVDGTDLSVVYALQLDGLSSATWRAPGGPFPPGQLDYVLYSDASLAVRRAFVFDSSDLSAAEREAHGLRADDSAAASDHLPIVVDFGWIEREPAAAVER